MACLIIHLSLAFYPFRRQILREVFLTHPQEEKNSLARGRGRPGKQNRGWSWVPYRDSEYATDALAENLPGHPPVVQRKFLAHKFIPRKNFRKI